MELLLFWIMFGVLGILVARNKGYSLGWWFFVGVMFPPGLLVLLFLPYKDEESKMRHKARKEKLQEEAQIRRENIKEAFSKEEFKKVGTDIKDVINRFKK